MFFSYWTNIAPAAEATETKTPLEQMEADWQRRYEEFRVFTDADLVVYLSKWSPTLPALFSRIRLPACRSDLARLILLHEFGGLYVDAHIATADAERLAQVVERLSSKELILFDRLDQRSWQGDCHIVNHCLGGRKGSPVLRKVILAAIRNLEKHEAAEAAAEGHVPYNVFVLTGPWNISITLFDRSSQDIRLLPEYEHFVHIEVLDRTKQPWPFQPYRYYHYREPGLHWSERQLVERLFESRPGD
jgi:hypothetical protein